MATALPSKWQRLCSNQEVQWIGGTTSASLRILPQTKSCFGRLIQSTRVASSPRTFSATPSMSYINPQLSCLHIDGLDYRGRNRKAPDLERRDSWRAHSMFGDGADGFVKKPMTFLGEPYMSEPFELEMAVRDSELDAFGVVNNAIFSVYIEHGRHELMRDMGLDIKAIMKTGDALALAEQSLRFFAPLRSGDHFVVSTRLSKVSAVRLNFEQTILKLPDREKVFEASSVACFLDKRYRPTRIPGEARVKFKKYCSSR